MKHYLFFVFLCSFDIPVYTCTSWSSSYGSAMHAHHDQCPNLTLDEMHSIQHYVINIVSDLQQVCGFLWVLQLPPPIKLTARI